MVERTPAAIAAALALMTAVATTIVAAKTIEETVEAEPGPLHLLAHQDDHPLDHHGDDHVNNQCAFRQSSTSPFVTSFGKHFGSAPPGRLYALRPPHMLPLRAWSYGQAHGWPVA
jgi:hypothetical protein